MAAKKTSVDKTPIEAAIEAAVVAPVEEKVEAVEAPKKRGRRPKTEAEAAVEVKAAAPAKKAPAKKEAAEKKEVKVEVTMQFAGKSYTQDDLMKIAKDVWRFDLKQTVSDLTSVELYVKPEESMVYYVFNGTERGSFAI